MTMIQQKNTHLKYITDIWMACNFCILTDNVNTFIFCFFFFCYNDYVSVFVFVIKTITKPKKKLCECVVLCCAVCILDFCFFFSNFLLSFTVFFLATKLCYLFSLLINNIFHFFLFFVWHSKSKQQQQ